MMPEQKPQPWLDGPEFSQLVYNCMEAYWTSSGGRQAGPVREILKSYIREQVANEQEALMNAVRAYGHVKTNEEIAATIAESIRTKKWGRNHE